MSSRCISARIAATSRTATSGCFGETVQVRLNLEMAVEPSIVLLALEIKPHQVTLVPERRAELTTEGGLDVAGQKARVASALSRCRDAGIEVALFIDPDQAQVDASIDLVRMRSSFTPAAMRTRRGAPSGSAS